MEKKRQKKKVNSKAVKNQGKPLKMTDEEWKNAAYTQSCEA